MRRFVVAAVVVCSLSAFAQSVDITVGGLHAGVHVEGAEVMDAPAPVVVVQQAPPPRVVGVDQFRLDYSTNPESRLVVLQPEGLAAQVWSDAGLEGQFVTPFSWAGRAGRYYRVIVFGVDGVPVLDRKVELRNFFQVTLSRLGVQPVVVQAPPTVVVQQPQAIAAGMPGPDFAALLAAVEEEGFSSDKLGVIRQAVDGGAWFTCAQVGQLVDLLAMGDDKVQVVSLTRARLVDPNNGFTLTKKFSFSSDKEKVRRLLGS